MGGILNGKGVGKSGEHGAKALHVRGFPYANTAAKFWTSLIDEVAVTYPPGVAIELAATAGGQLTPALLDPERLLQRDMDRLAENPNPETLQDAIDVLALIGPSGSITLRMILPGLEARPQEIELDYLDADLLPFLLAWLLEWAGVPDSLWNQERVRGAFAGDDPLRHIRYMVAFDLRSKLLSEELYTRSVRVHFRRESLRKPVPAGPGAE